jgi:hypothetical protein
MAAMSDKLQDIVIKIGIGLAGFMLYWMFTTNSKVDSLMMRDEAMSKFWKIHAATKDKLNEVIAVMNEFDDVDMEAFSWPDL